MSGHPHGGHYDNGYGHQDGNTDSYYADEHNQGYYDHGTGYGDHQLDQHHGHVQGADGYYDESGYYNADANNPYHQDGGYYEGQEHVGHYQDEYYNDQYYDQGAPAAGQQPYQGQGGYAVKGKRRGDSEEDSETFSDFTMRSDMARAADMDYYGRGDERYNSYNESQMGGRGYRPPSSQISYGGNRSSGASTPNYGMDYNNVLPAGQRSREPYPAWTSEAQIPLSKEEVEDIFLDLTAKFGFQRDSMRTLPP